MPNQIAFYPQVSGGGGSGAITLIQKQVLSVAAATVTFSAIPGTYTNLMLIVNARGTTGASQTFGVQVNGDSSALYTTLATINSAGTVSGLAISASTLGTLGVLASGGGVTALKATIPNYAGTTFTKSMLSEVSAGVGAATGALDQIVVNYGSTSAIASLTFLTDGGSTYAIGSTFSLYGMQ